MVTNNAHTFTQSGMGAAPFKLVADNHPGALANGFFACEHCGTMLKNRFFVQSADGRVSVVGIDCLNKTGDDGLIAGAKRLISKARAEAREQRSEIEREAREGVERQLFNGKTRAEALDEVVERIKAASAEAADRISDHRVMQALDNTNGDFAQDMRALGRDLREWSQGMQAAITSLVCKGLSGGARKNSKAYLAFQDEAAALVAECMALIEAERNAINVLKDLHRDIQLKRA